MSPEINIVLFGLSGALQPLRDSDVALFWLRPECRARYRVMPVYLSRDRSFHQ